MKIKETADASQFAGKSLFITTPCYGGQVCSDWAMSLSLLRVQLEMLKIKYHIFLLNGDSLICRARSRCATQFLSDPREFTHMIFIDADTVFEANDVLKFLYSDEDLLVGAVPKKTFPIQYNSAAIVDHDGEYIVHKNKFIEVEYGGTAFMMIKRQVFKKIQESYPELKHEPYPDELETMPARIPKDITNNPNYEADWEEIYKKNSYAYFDPQIKKRDRTDSSSTSPSRYFAEDYMFCRRWTDIGGKILLDPSVKLNHYGDHLFCGDLTGFKELQALKENIEREPSLVREKDN
jgi:hypothetical protein